MNMVLGSNKYCLNNLLILCTTICFNNGWLRMLHAAESYGPKSDAHNLFAGYVVPRKRYKITIGDTIREESDENGNFEIKIDRQNNLFEQKLVIEIRPVNGCQVRIWTVKNIDFQLLYKFNFGVTEMPAMLKWSFTHLDSSRDLKDGEMYKWVIINAKSGIILQQQKFGMNAQNGKEAEDAEEINFQIFWNFPIENDDEFHILLMKKEIVGNKYFFRDSEEYCCCICLEPFNSVNDAWKPVGCKNHFVHRRELKRWLHEHDTCPTCGMWLPNRNIKRANIAEDGASICQISRERTIRRFSIGRPILSGPFWLHAFEFVYKLDCSMRLEVMLTNWHEASKGNAHLGTQLAHWENTFWEHRFERENILLAKQAKQNAMEELAQQMAEAQTISAIKN